MKKLDLKWFQDRIGKRVYRNKRSCNCDTCRKVESMGMIIEDNVHAMYLNDVYHDFNADGDYIMYFDSIEERDQDKNITN